MMPIQSRHPAQSAQIAAPHSAAHDGSAQASPTTPGKFNVFHRGRRITHAMRKPASGSAAKPLKQLSPRPQPATSGAANPGAKPERGARTAAAVKAHAGKNRSSQSRDSHGGNALPHEDYLPREHAHEHDRQQKNQQQHQHPEDEEERQREGVDSQDNEDDDNRRPGNGFMRTAGLSAAMRAERDVSTAGSMRSFAAPIGSEPHDAPALLQARYARVLLDTLRGPASSQGSATAALLDIQSAFPHGIAMPGVDGPMVAIKAALLDADAGRAAIVGVPGASSVQLQFPQRLFVLAPLLLLIAERPTTQSALAAAAARRAALRNNVTATHTRARDEASGISREVPTLSARAPRNL